MEAQIGDKVRVKSGPSAGARAVVEKVNRRRLLVRTESGSERLSLDLSEVTNLSLAARKAWESMPTRRVGRPVGSKTSERTSVTLRIDCDLWDEFRQCESTGLIIDRSDTINKWIRQQLQKLNRTPKNGNGKKDHT